MTTIAAAPSKHPLIAYIATAKIVNEPARTTIPFPISSHDIPPIDLRAADSNNIDADMAAIPILAAII